MWLLGLKQNTKKTFEENYLDQNFSHKFQIINKTASGQKPRQYLKLHHGCEISGFHYSVTESSFFSDIAQHRLVAGYLLLRIDLHHTTSQKSTQLHHCSILPHNFPLIIFHH